MAEIVVGAAVADLLTTIKKAKASTVELDASFDRLKCTIQSLPPKTEDFNQLDNDRTVSSNEQATVREENMSKLKQKLKGGMELVTECSRMPRWHIWKRYMYSKQLLKLESGLHKFSCMNIQADIWRDSKELVLHVTCMLNALKTHVCPDMADAERGSVETKISCLGCDLTNKENQQQKMNVEDAEREWNSKSCYLFTLQELKDATCNFDANLVIGKGCFGTTVYKGMLQYTVVAIKTIQTEKTLGSSRFKEDVSISSLMYLW